MYFLWLTEKSWLINFRHYVNFIKKSQTLKTNGTFSQCHQIVIKVLWDKKIFVACYLFGFLESSQKVFVRIQIFSFESKCSFTEIYSNSKIFLVEFKYFDALRQIFLPTEIFCLNGLAKIQKAREASCHPALTGSCPTLLLQYTF